jgi:processive 1,2-diacylglycerol beta-glucosyltransferase
VIWILTAGFGDGHNAAARGTAEAVGLRFADETVVTEDWLKTVHPWLAELSMAAYRQVIVHFPSLWRWIYQKVAEDAGQVLDSPMLMFMRERMVRELQIRKPRLIVSTYPLYASLLTLLRREGIAVPPVITVVTDAVSIHPSWVMGDSDAYAVIDDASREVLHGLGVPREKVWVTGFPVSLKIQAACAITQPSRDLLYLPSTDNAHVAATLTALVPLVKRGLRLTLVLGRHEARLHHLLKHFEPQFTGSDVQIIGWTSEMPHLLAAHRLVITKAGGAIVHELMAAGAVGIIDNILPGQEEGNAAELVSVDGGVITASPEETATAVDRLLANDGAEATRLRANLLKTRHATAALRLVDEVFPAVLR